MSLTGEPKQSRWRQTLEKGKDVFRGVGIVFRTGSFLIILVGNIISVIIGLGLGYKIMYLQVCAHPHWSVVHIQGQRRVLFIMEIKQV